MPISSLNNHNRTIGVFHLNQYKHKSSTQFKNDTILSQNTFLADGRLIQQLVHASNLEYAGEKRYDVIKKQMYAASLLHLTTLLLSIKPHGGVYNKGLPLDQKLLLPSVPAVHHTVNNSLVNADVLIDDAIVLPKNNIRNKRTAGCTCEAPKEINTEKRQRARARTKTKAKARAEARAAVRAEAQAAVRAEAMGSSIHMIGAAAGTATGNAAGTLGKIAGAAAGTALGAVVGAGAAGVLGGKSVMSEDAGLPDNKNTVDSPVKTEPSESAKSKVVMANIMTHTSAVNNEINYMNPYDMPVVGVSASIQNIDIRNIPKLTEFIRPMNYYRWLFQHSKTDKLAEIEQQIKYHYRTDDILMHSFKDSVWDIPDRFNYLKNNIEIFRAEVSKAEDMVNKALDKFQRTTRRNDYGHLQYPPQNSIRAYLKGSLGTDDVSILHQAMLRLEYYLLELRKFFGKYKGNIIFATAKKLNVEYIRNQQSPMGFVLPMDSGKRVVVMVDLFEGDLALNNRLHITLLHEASHIQAGSRDFVSSPITRLVGDASEILELFNEAMYTNGNEAIACDELFLQCYENFLDINVNEGQFMQLIKSDPMLQKNIMMDNADSIAQYIFDIASSRAYNQDYISQPRHRRNAGTGHRPIFIKAILNLLIKQGGVA